MKLRPVEIKKPITKMEMDLSGTAPPSSINVDLERKPILFRPDGKALVRTIGY